MGSREIHLNKGCTAWLARVIHSKEGCTAWLTEEIHLHAPYVILGKEPNISEWSMQGEVLVDEHIELVQGV